MFKIISAVYLTAFTAYAFADIGVKGLLAIGVFMVVPYALGFVTAHLEDKDK